MDLYNDGRHEVLFGGNTCCGEMLRMAIGTDRGVVIVQREDGKDLVLKNGYLNLRSGEAWAVFGCYMKKGAALAQVIATVDGDELLHRRTWFDIEDGIARIAGQETYRIPDPGRKLRGRDVSESLAACIEVIEMV